MFTFPLIGKTVTVTLGPLGNNFVLNGKLAHVNAEMAYTNLTTPHVYISSLTMFITDIRMTLVCLGLRSCTTARTRN